MISITNAIQKFDKNSTTSDHNVHLIFKVGLEYSIAGVANFSVYKIYFLS